MFYHSFTFCIKSAHSHAKRADVNHFIIPSFPSNPQLVVLVFLFRVFLRPPPELHFIKNQKILNVFFFYCKTNSHTCAVTYLYAR